MVFASHPPSGSDCFASAVPVPIQPAPTVHPQAFFRPPHASSSASGVSAKHLRTKRELAKKYRHPAEGAAGETILKSNSVGHPAKAMAIDADDGSPTAPEFTVDQRQLIRHNLQQRIRMRMLQKGQLPPNPTAEELQLCGLYPMPMAYPYFVLMNPSMGLGGQPVVAGGSPFPLVDSIGNPFSYASDSAPSLFSPTFLQPAHLHQPLSPTMKKIAKPRKTKTPKASDFAKGRKSAPPVAQQPEPDFPATPTIDPTLFDMPSPFDVFSIHPDSVEATSKNDLFVKPDLLDGFDNLCVDFGVDLSATQLFDSQFLTLYDF